MKTDYDKTKFDMDEYGNLIPKKPIKGITADGRYGKDVKDETDASEEVGR